jgi:DNA topoisomerase-1
VEDASLKILNGRWGPYISFGKNNIKIPKGTDVSDMTYQTCKELCDKALTGEKGGKSKDKKAVSSTKKTIVAKRTASKKQ